MTPVFRERLISVARLTVGPTIAIGLLLGLGQGLKCIVNKPDEPRVASGSRENGPHQTGVAPSDPQADSR